MKKLIYNEKTFKKYVENFRKKHIPDNYNQIALVDHLLNKEIDHYISISNRTDGKTFNYLQFFCKFSEDYDIGFMLIARNWTVRNDYMETLQAIFRESTILEEEELHFISSQRLMKILYKEKTIGIITDLNNATNLKYISNFIANFPILIYDEFLAIEGDYLPDEWERLKTIYSSVDRKGKIPLIHFPKIFYLGNAVNFSSPILAHLNIFNILEKHPINEVKQYDNILIEMRRNDIQNTNRNLRAFSEDTDNLTTGQFKVNDYNIINDHQRKAMLKDKETIMVKLDMHYLRIDYSPSHRLINLSIVGYADDYEYNSEISDNKEDSIYLKESYYSENEEKKHIKSYYLYDNQFSKEIITSNQRISFLKLTKIIGEYVESQKDIPLAEKTEMRYENNYRERTLKYLLKRFE